MVEISKRSLKYKSPSEPQSAQLGRSKGQETKTEAENTELKCIYLTDISSLVSATSSLATNSENCTNSLEKVLRFVETFTKREVKAIAEIEGALENFKTQLINTTTNYYRVAPDQLPLLVRVAEKLEKIRKNEISIPPEEFKSVYALLKPTTEIEKLPMKDEKKFKEAFLEMVKKEITEVDREATQTIALKARSKLNENEFNRRVQNELQKNKTLLESLMIWELFPCAQILFEKAKAVEFNVEALETDEAAVWRTAFRTYNSKCATYPTLGAILILQYFPVFKKDQDAQKFCVSFSNLITSNIEDEKKKKSGKSKSIPETKGIGTVNILIANFGFEEVLRVLVTSDISKIFRALDIASAKIKNREMDL